MQGITSLWEGRAPSPKAKVRGISDDAKRAHIGSDAPRTGPAANSYRQLRSLGVSLRSPLGGYGYVFALVSVGGCARESIHALGCSSVPRRKRIGIGRLTSTPEPITVCSSPLFFSFLPCRVAPHAPHNYAQRIPPRGCVTAGGGDICGNSRQCARRRLCG